MNPVIETDHLAKVYRTKLGKPSITALNEVSLTVAQGEIFALLGLNGAGKSTLTKILLDLVRPTSGTVSLFGQPVSSGRWKSKVGYLPELFQAPKGLTAKALLRYIGELSGLRGKTLSGRIDEILETVGLRNALFQKVDTFSKGMVLRLGIAQAMLHEPPLLLLDEPTEGLDPLGRKTIRGLLIELRGKGTTILLNSHLLSEIELVADRIAILHRGQIVAIGAMTELLPQNHQFEVEVSLNPSLPGSWQFQQQASSWLCEVQGSDQLQQLLSALQSKSIPVVAVRSTRTTLEDVFFSYVRDGAHD